MDDLILRKPDENMLDEIADYRTAMLDAGSSMDGCSMLALPEAKKRRIDRVLITCDEDNIGSARTIEANGGVFERTATLDGEVLRRYWIKL